MSKLIKGAGGGGGKSGGGDARTPVESPDSLRSIQYARVLDLLTEGEIGGLVDGFKSITLDDTPLQNANGTFNFTGVSVFTRNGTQSQSHIPAFAGSEAELCQSHGQSATLITLQHVSPFLSRSLPFKTSPTAIWAVRL
jgi:hypothetical protein